MRKHRYLFMSVVLVLAMVIPRSSSANPGPVKETPIPIEDYDLARLRKPQTIKKYWW